MSSFDVFLCALVLGVLVFQVWLTFRVFRSPLFEREQKMWQARLIWLLPLLGSVLVFTVLREEDEHERRRQGIERSP